MLTLWLALTLTAQTIAFAQSDEGAESRYARRIMAFWQDGDAVLAEAEIGRFFNQYPQSGYSDHFHLLLGDKEWKQKAYEQALFHYAAVQDPLLLQKIHPKHLDCLYHLKMFEALIQQAKPAMQPGTTQEALVIYYLAEALFQRPSYAEAASWYSKLIGTAYETHALQALSEIQCAMGAYREAAEMLLLVGEKIPQKRREILERSSKLLLAQAILLFDLADYDGFIREVAEQESHPFLDVYLGRAYYHLKQYAKAQEILLPHLGKSPHEREILLTLTLTACELNQKEQAELWAAQYEQQFSGDRQILERLAVFDQREGHYERAVEKLERLAADFGGESLLILAQQKEQSGEVEMALVLYKHSREPLAELYWARLLFSQIPRKERTITHAQTLSVLNSLKELQMRRQFQTEPVHFEAAIDYAAFRSSLEPSEKRLSLERQLLLRAKEEIQRQEGLWAKDYHATRLKMVEKADLYQAYLMLLDGHIFRLDSQLQPKEGAIKERAARELYQKLLQGKFAVSNYIRDQAQSGLQQIDEVLLH